MKRAVNCEPPGHPFMTHTRAPARTNRFTTNTRHMPPSSDPEREPGPLLLSRRILVFPSLCPSWLFIPNPTSWSSTCPPPPLSILSKSSLQHHSSDRGNRRRLRGRLRRKPTERSAVPWREDERAQQTENNKDDKKEYKPSFARASLVGKQACSRSSLWP